MCYRATFVLCMFLTGCCTKFFSCDMEVAAEKHADKLRKHFIGDSTVDVSTLIHETRAVSGRLKRAGMYEQANKFDSYTDVLMYGNNTLPESINDVMELVKHRNCVCPTLQGLKTHICNGLFR
ncbi:MAG: hypothetical protein LBP41_02710 [Holosporaceae bacterium]|nr:hypothetical protein [Holosporaceae bacterium]